MLNMKQQRIILFCTSEDEKQEKHNPTKEWEPQEIWPLR